MPKTSVTAVSARTTPPIETTNHRMKRATRCLPRYDSDLVHFKPRADLLLVGHCHPPRGRAVSEWKVTFRVGKHARSLSVSGDRDWSSGLMSSKISAPQQFGSLELRYENSFGGVGYAANPAGLGFAKIEDESGRQVQSLPNIEDPRDPVQSPRSKPAPAGFGPLASSWELSEGGVADAVVKMDELGIVSNGPDSTLGNYDLDRIQAIIHTVADMEAFAVPAGLTAADLVTNEFIDPSIGR